MIKSLGQLIGMMIGSFLSPSWLMLHHVLKDYFNLERALSGPLHMIAEFQRFNMLVAQSPDEVSQQLLPALIGILCVSLLFVSGCSYVSGQIACIVSDKLGFKSPAEEKPLLQGSSFQTPWMLKQ